MLRRIFGPKRNEVTRESRKLHSEELNNLYSSHHIVLMIKTRKMRLGEVCSAYGGEERRIQGFCVGT